MIDLSRTLDYRPRFDPKSKDYPIRSLLPDTAFPSFAPSHPGRSFVHHTYTHLDQGREGACVGFGTSAELIATPAVVPNIDNHFAFSLYKMAQTLDDTPGEAYEGTSVLAGAKAAHNAGFMDEYRWIFASAANSQRLSQSILDIVQTLGYMGPIVLGVNWYTGMFDPDSAGVVRPSGQVEGGHCVLAKGIHYDKAAPLNSMIVLQNSWGNDWGMGGDCLILLSDLILLLDQDGEACVFVRRHIKPHPATPASLSAPVSSSSSSPAPSSIPAS